MKRAILLITVITVFSLTVAIAIDQFQATTAEAYLRELWKVREAILDNDMENAWDQHSFLYANWQHDAGIMNFFISHHHTRAVSTAMLQLATAIEMGWQEEAIKNIDSLQDALSDVQCSDYYKWENFF